MLVSNNNSRYLHPRVIGMYAYEIVSSLGGWGEARGNMDNNLPPYIYLTEKIDQYLLSHSSQTLRRIRNHSYYYPGDTSLADVIHQYKLAIAGSPNTHASESEDPLQHLMLSSGSRDTLIGITYNSEDYEEGLADPLEDEKCEAAPKNADWMLRPRVTCNFVHEFDFTLSLRRGKTKLLGNGYWRDVWPVLDPLPTSRRSQQKKVALKTIRYEHDYTERNLDRHIRDAIVSERLTSSPLVTSIYAFCGHSGYFEFATGGSLADRLEESYMAKMDVENQEDMGRGNASNNDEDILDQHEKLRLAHQVAAGLADMHDADAMRNEKGEIISSAIVHADITTDQYIKVGEVYKLNDFNRCRFMRRYRNSDTAGGDGTPCGFHVQNNPAKNRSPEEYRYDVETEKIDVYSMGNIFYTILTDLDPWEDTSSKAAQKAVVRGDRPALPQAVKASDDFVDVALRKMMYECWEHKPKDRPRARHVADYMLQQLRELEKKS